MDVSNKIKETKQDIHLNVLKQATVDVRIIIFQTLLNGSDLRFKNKDSCTYEPLNKKLTLQCFKG